MTTPARARYTGYRFPAEIIGHAVWLYFRFPLGLAARGIIVSHETVRQWARKVGQRFACARLPEPYLTGSGPAFSATLTTTALYRRSLR